MDSHPLTSELEAALAADGWVTQLVRRLVGEHDADDVVQQVWLAALQRPPRAEKARAWVASVAHRCAMRWHRDQSRRTQREGAAAREDTVPSTAQLLQRVEAQRQVARLVAELDEPFRVAVLLRYSEGMTPGAIARHLSVPAATVRSRLHRALARIRRQLEAERGPDWRTGFGVLFPGVGESAAPLPWAAPAPLLPGVIAMTGSKKGISIALLVLTLTTLWFAGFPGTLFSGAPAPEVEAVAPMRATSPAPERAAAPARAPVVAAPAPDGAALPPAGISIRGRVVDTAGVTVGGVEVGLQPYLGQGVAWQPVREVAAVSGADGSFELEAPRESLVLSAGGEYFTLRGLRIEPEVTEYQNVLLVVAEDEELRGRVVDAHGMPLPDVRVSMFSLLLDGFPLPLDGGLVQALETRTEKDGSFVLEHAPTTAAVTVHFSKPGYVGAFRRCLDGRGRPVLVELVQQSSEHRDLTGVVLDAGGRAVPDARVAAGYRESTVTSQTGEFSLGWNGRAARLVATVRGLQPAVFDLRSGSGELDRPIVMTIGGPCAEIAGTVLDADGEPAAGMMVGLVDPTPCGGAFVEQLVAPADAGELMANRGALARTGADGRFVVPGLSDRSYRLRVFDPDTALAVESDPIPPGDRDAVVRIPAGAIVAEVHGQVVDSAGEPVPEVEIRVMLVGGGGAGVFRIGSGPTAVSDREGRFVLRDMPRRHVSIALIGETILEHQLDVEDVEIDRPLRIVVERRCGVRVIAGAAAPGTRVHFEDADGEQLPIMTFTAEYSMSVGSWSLDRGDSPVLTLSEHAVAMVATVGGQEVSRQPIAVRRGQVVTVRVN